jgi:mRNA interferase RelE/StbE
MYRIKYTKRFDKQLEKLGKENAVKILNYLHKNIDRTENPRALGKELTGNRKGYWRYRVGDYRIICDIQDKECIVLALETGHRKEIYQ